ncbi:hypothetical protein QM012_008617 [Aureobasidium pullulans]|uniref:BTB domain-containing protein n=1 Tax=Aureobasidium pullulans TaxID=5580 RepID=A0ABR0TJX4_AURPU
MELMEPYDRRIWRWWVMSYIISKSHDAIQIKSQDDDSESPSIATVNKELLCFYSPYYTAAIKGSFSECHKKVFTLRLSALQTQMFVEWLYIGRYEYVSPQNDDIHMCALYILADQTDIIALRRTIMARMRFCYRPMTPGLMVRTVSQLPGGSGLRRYLLEEAVAEQM